MNPCKLMLRVFFKHTLLLVLGLVCLQPSFAQERLIAITMDDLPFVGDSKNFHLNLIIDCIEKNHIPVTGFIIADTVNTANWPVLERFRATGNSLGNHTLSHLSVNQVDTAGYINQIAKADAILSPVLTHPKFFRYPYLAMGTGEKKEQILDFLASQHYHVAPVTIDSKDFVFNQQLLATPEPLRREFIKELIPVYLDYILLQTLDAEKFNRSNHFENRAQILLIHANLLNAYVLCDIIQLYKELGYRFVSLEDALTTFPKSTKHRPSSTQAPIQRSIPPPASSDTIDNDIESFKVWD